MSKYFSMKSVRDPVGGFIDEESRDLDGTRRHSAPAVRSRRAEPEGLSWGAGWPARGERQAWQAWAQAHGPGRTAQGRGGRGDAIRKRIR